MQETCPLCHTSAFVQAIDSHTICTQCGTVLDQSIITTTTQMNFNLNEQPTRVVDNKQYSSQQRAILLCKLQSLLERRQYSRNKKIEDLTQLIGGLPGHIVQCVRRIIHSIMEQKKGINLTKLFLVTVAYVSKMEDLQSFNLKNAKKKLNLVKMRHFYALQRLVISAHSQLVASPVQAMTPTNSLLKLKHLISNLVDLHKKEIATNCKEMRDFLVKQRFKRVTVVKGQAQRFKPCLSNAEEGWKKLKQFIQQKVQDHMKDKSIKTAIKRVFSSIGCNLRPQAVQDQIDAFH